MSAEEHKALILRGYEAGERGDWEAVFAMFDPACSFPDLVLYGFEPTLESYKQFVSAVTTAFSERKNIPEKMVAEGDTVMVWLTQLNRHTGPWRAIPATNKQVSTRAVECFRLRGGKVIEFRVLTDTLSFLQQIGAFPSPK
jgi:ketosteroid isomerase-like protein